MSIHFRPQDPLKVLTQEVVFSQGKKGEDQDEEEESKDKERLLEIWNSFFKFETKSQRPIILKKPLLKAISKQLNSTVLQDQIYEKILVAKHGSEKDRKEGEALIKNLESINAKIDKANHIKGWFQKIPIPLMSKIFAVIDRVKIPTLKN